MNITACFYCVRTVTPADNFVCVEWEDGRLHYRGVYDHRLGCAPFSAELVACLECYQQHKAMGVAA